MMTSSIDAVGAKTTYKTNTVKQEAQGVAITDAVANEMLKIAGVAAEDIEGDSGAKQALKDCFLFAENKYYVKSQAGSKESLVKFFGLDYEKGITQDVMKAFLVSTHERQVGYFVVVGEAKSFKEMVAMCCEAKATKPWSRDTTLQKTQTYDSSVNNFSEGNRTNGVINAFDKIKGVTGVAVATDNKEDKSITFTNNSNNQKATISVSKAKWENIAKVTGSGKNSLEDQQFIIKSLIESAPKATIAVKDTNLDNQSATKGLGADSFVAKVPEMVEKKPLLESVIQAINAVSDIKNLSVTTEQEVRKLSSPTATDTDTTTIQTAVITTATSLLTTDNIVEAVVFRTTMAKQYSRMDFTKFDVTIQGTIKDYLEASPTQEGVASIVSAINDLGKLDTLWSEILKKLNEFSAKPVVVVEEIKDRATEEGKLPLVYSGGDVMLTLTEGVKLKSGDYGLLYIDGKLVQAVMTVTASSDGCSGDVSFVELPVDKTGPLTVKTKESLVHVGTISPQVVMN